MDPMDGVLIGGLMGIIFALVAIFIDRRQRSKHP